jgi:shikimate kinase
MTGRNIILTGFMGTGKSVVGRALARRLHRKFIDTDALIENTAGMSIVRLFADKGEPFFRKLEKQAIAHACTEEKAVIATGGGAMIDEENVKQLKACGTVICLTATPEVILSRVQGNTDRPLLQADDPLTTIRELLAARAEAYAQADTMIETSHLSVEGVVNVIVSALERNVKV